LILGGVIAAPWAFAETTYSFNLPEQSLGDSLRAIGQQTEMNILFEPNAVKNTRSPALRGQYTVDEAIRLVLAGTKLEAHHTAASNVVIKVKSARSTALPATNVDVAPRLAQANLSNQPQAASENSQAENVPASKSEEEKKRDLAEIIVTGTHIRGAASAGSPVTTYTRDDIDKSGAATVDQFARQMVENFSAIDSVANANSNAGLGRFNNGAVTNVFGGAAFDLHGLGPSATLTLLNGHRLAPAGLDGSLTDVSQIPLSVVDRIEVLADGASAIYGADAVAGVVDIITRKDFDGAETGVRYGGATGGGAIELTGSQLLGRSWSSGNVLLNYEYDKQHGLDASQRNYIPDLGGPFSIIPQNRRNSIFLDGRQSVGVDTTISGNVMYSDRDAFSSVTSKGPGFFESAVEDGRAKQSGATFTIDRALLHQWHADVTGNYSRIQQTSDNPLTGVFGSSTFSAFQSLLADTDILGLDILADGPLFSLPGGQVKAAFGASFRAEKFASHVITTISGNTLPFTADALQRHVKSGFVEFFVPVIGSANAIAGARRLELSLAVRSDSYSDFGSTVNPKFGLLWEPVLGLDVRGTYGTSFRAPLLSQLDSPMQSQADFFPDSTAPTGLTDTLTLSGGNPKLRPEKSRSFTVGFDVKPAALPELKLTATYFHITFKDRISTPPVASGYSILTDPVVAPFVEHNPPLAAVQAYFNSPGFTGDFAGLGPAGVKAILDGRYANIAATKESGVDVTASYGVPTNYGHFSFSVAVDRLFVNDFQASSAAPYFALLNSFGTPTEWKEHGNIGWRLGSFTAAVTVNYVNGYQNSLITPQQRIASWTTGDLYLGYNTGKVASARLLENLTVALSVQNVTNQAPPYAQVAPNIPGENFIPFDPTNASPVGRLIALQLKKRW
jgi:iron complex outermembrane receptor protein